MIERVPHGKLLTVAEVRVQQHSGRPGSTPMGTSHIKTEYIGLVGEEQFAFEFNSPMNLEDTPSGDSGIDNVIDSPTLGRLVTIDVKTACNPGHCLVPVGNGRAEVFVQVGYIDASDEAYLIGWTTAAYIGTFPARSFKYPKINLYQRSSTLYPIKALHELFRGRPEAK